MRCCWELRSPSGAQPCAHRVLSPVFADFAHTGDPPTTQLRASRSVAQARMRWQCEGPQMGSEGPDHSPGHKKGYSSAHLLGGSDQLFDGGESSSRSQMAFNCLVSKKGNAKGWPREEVLSLPAGLTTGSAGSRLQREGAGPPGFHTTPLGMSRFRVYHF